MRRNRFPDYFGSSRSIEPVHGRQREDHYRVEESGGGMNIDVEGEYDDSYAVRPTVRTQAAVPTTTSYPRSSAFRPNQWAQPGTQPASKRAPPPARQNFLREFAYREPNTHSGRAASLAPRMQAPPHNVQTPRHQSIRQHNNAEQPLPQTPWSNRPAARPNWLRQPREEQTEAHRPLVLENRGYGVYPPREELVSDPYGPSAENNNSNRNYGVQPPRPRGRQPQLMAPPTPRHSSPSPLSAVQTRIQPPRIQPRHNPAPQINGIELISPKSLDKRFQSIFPYEHFNAVQSSCFSCVYGSNYNVVVAAPTGSGKTVIFELAICKLLATKNKKDVKIVYQATTKALCSERTRDWQKKFKALGLQVAEFTGDTSAVEVRRARTASVIITTPEKWDSITRKWSDHGAMLKTIKLVLIDEVHILKDSRGATLETVVSRMKTLGSEMRFIALSATIPNSTDIAQWLGLTHTSPQVPAKTFVYGEEFRPVRLEKVVVGYNMGGGNEHSFDSFLDDQLPDLIVKHAQGKPVLIFCFTRKSTESAAMVLADYWTMCAATQKPWLGPSVAIRSTARLQNFVTSGVAFHHGGLERQDRDSIEDAFLRGHLSIVCCTSTLAVGVNLPCHTVILKGTMGYQNGKFAEYDEFEVMQMIGRAGRPQFDTSATAIILTRAESRDKYMNIESGCQLVESTLHLNLIEHLNSEIVLGTISSLTKAVQWLRGTFLAVRLRQNPDHYQLTNANAHAKTTDDQLQEICKIGTTRLADVGLIKYVDDSESEFRGTQHGRAMSTYMVCFETMVMMLGFPKSLTMEELVNSLCHASEFDALRIKSTERQGLRELNKTDNIPFKFKDNIMETWQKISVLIQVELSRGTLPYQQRIAMEAKQAIERMQRLLESYIVCMIADNNGHGTKIALEFSRSLLARAWEGHQAQLCQVPDIGPANMKKLVDKQVTTVLELADLGTVSIERFLSKNPPAAMKIADSLHSFPRLMLDGHVARSPRSDGNDIAGPGRETKAFARVKFGCKNESVLPRWRNKVPPATFFATTAEGTLLHIWRGRLQDKQHEVSFPVTLNDADTVFCYYTCDDIVGTVQSLQLPCIDVPQEDFANQYPVGPPALNNGTKTSVSVLRTPREPNPPKRQKLMNHSTNLVTIGDAVIDCIDLSTVDDDGSEHAESPQNKKRRRELVNIAPKRENLDSFAFESVPARQPRNCSGGGTQQDPFTLDEPGSDDFDTDIFDDVELPAMKEAPKPRVPVEKDSSKAVFKSYGTDTQLEEAIREIDYSPKSTDVLDDVGDTVYIPLEPVVPVTPQVLGPPVGLSHRIEVAEGSKERVSVFGGRDVLLSHGEQQIRQEVAENATDAPKKGDYTPQEPSEPSWVVSSSSSIVDFLRGHVKFV